LSASDGVGSPLGWLCIKTIAAAMTMIAALNASFSPRNHLSPHSTSPVAQIRRLTEWLRAEVAEFRRPQALACPMAGVVSLIIMAMARGVRQGPDDLAQFADTLSEGQRRALGFRRNKRTQRIRCPKKTTFHRVLSEVDVQGLKRVLLI
jgi:hypothetical protein